MDLISICEEFNIKNYNINYDGTIDVFEKVSINRKGLTELPISFRNVYGDFNCYSNKLTTLKGSPIRVSGDFVCSWNRLTSLDYSPEIICGDLYCQNNKIVCIENGPNLLTGEFYCDELDIEGLKYLNDHNINRLINYNDFLRIKNRKTIIEKLLSNK